MVRCWEPLLTCSKNSRKNNVKVAWYWNKNLLLLICLISRLFCSKGWSNYLVNWSDLFQKMVKLTLRLEWVERLEQVTKGQMYEPYLSTPGFWHDSDVCCFFKIEIRIENLFYPIVQCTVCRPSSSLHLGDFFPDLWEQCATGYKERASIHTWCDHGYGVLSLILIFN